MSRPDVALTRHAEFVLRESQRGFEEPEIDRIAREQGSDEVVLVARGADGRWHSTAVPRTSRPRNARRIRP